MKLVWDVLGVCLGNTVWLAGLLTLGLGIWALRVRKESIQKVVGMMSMMTGGQPKGPALKLKSLVDPEERTKPLGRRLLVVAVVLLLFGSTMVVKCSGGSASSCASAKSLPCPPPGPEHHTK